MGKRRIGWERREEKRRRGIEKLQIAFLLPTQGSSWPHCAKCPEHPASHEPSLMPAGEERLACQRGSDRQSVVAVPPLSFQPEGSTFLHITATMQSNVHKFQCTPTHVHIIVC